MTAATEIFCTYSWSPVVCSRPSLRFKGCRISAELCLPHHQGTMRSDWAEHERSPGPGPPYPRPQRTALWAQQDSLAAAPTHFQMPPLPPIRTGFGSPIKGSLSPSKDIGGGGPGRLNSFASAASFSDWMPAGQQGGASKAPQRVDRAGRRAQHRRRCMSLLGCMLLLGALSVLRPPRQRQQWERRTRNARGEAAVPCHSAASRAGGPFGSRRQCFGPQCGQ